MDFKQISEMWARDSKIDPLQIGKEAVSSASLSSKYSNFLIQIKKERSKQETVVKKLRRDKWMLYSGKAEGQDYRDNPYANFRIPGGDVKTFVEADEAIRAEEEKLDFMDAVIEFLERVLRQIDKRDWQLRLSFEWERFLGGGR